MEPLSRPVKLIAAAYLLLSFGALLLLPLLLALGRYLLDFDFAFLGAAFWWILARAIFFAFLESILSVFSVGLFVLIMAFLFFPREGHSGSIRIFEVTGLLSFSMSPALVAMCLMILPLRLGMGPANGLWAIVGCHFLLNAAYFSSNFLTRQNRYYSQQGKALETYLISLGASRLLRAKMLIWPHFHADFMSWGPQVFLWSFMSFVPVILFSAGPEQSTPEILLYYSLLNDPSGSRMIVIFLVTGAISLLLNRLARPKERLTFIEESSPLDIGGPKVNRRSLGLSFISMLLLLPFLTSLNLSSLSPSIVRELLSPLFSTLAIFSLSMCFSFAFSVASLLCPKEITLISYANFVSPPMILVGLYGYADDSPAKIPWVSAGLAISILPWLHRKLRSHVRAIPEDLTTLALSLGLRNWSYFRYLLWPELKGVLISLSLLVGLWSLGEYTFSKAILEPSSTLSLLVEERMRRYQFREASAALTLLLFLSLLSVLPIIFRKKKLEQETCITN